MRRELKNRGITGVKVLYSREEPRQSPLAPTETRRSIPASISFVPSAAGLIIAGEIIREITGVQ
jgi:tRNA A37 threonylcarbamoyladenosine dehydratase